MYSPILNEKLVRTLYRVKRSYKRPMTEIAEEMIQKALYSVNKELVCKACVNEKNNDCTDCYLSDGKN